MSAMSGQKSAKHGVVKVPVVMQMEALECGAACLDMVLAYYGKWVTLAEVRSACGVGRDGAKASNILRAARYYGLEAKGGRCEPEFLRTQGQFPCIVHWNFTHFVVLRGFKKNKVYLNDPARGDYTVSYEEFNRSFTGVYLKFAPGPDFQPEGFKKSLLTYCREHTEGARGAMRIVAVATLVSLLAATAMPFFSRYFVDSILGDANTQALIPFTIILALVALIQVIVGFRQAIGLLRMQGQMEVRGRSAFMWHVLNMPMRFFSQREAGDLQQRMEQSGTITNSIVRTLIPLVLNALMMVVYLVIMVVISPVLAAIGLLSVIINCWIASLGAQARLNITRVAQRDLGKLVSATISAASMIETIKSSGAEDGFFQSWAGHQASANVQAVQYAYAQQRYSTVPRLVTSLASCVILCVAVFLMMQGAFGAGSIMAFQGILTAFTAPALMLTEASQQLQEMYTQMERIEDVMAYPEDQIFSQESPDEVKVFKKLTGHIEMKNVSFGYAPLDPPLIEDFNLTVEPGASIALVGGSGCGKSTIASLMSGLNSPWAGEVLFDGKPLSSINENVFRGSVAVVDQDITLFQDSIMNNLKMWDESIKDYEVIVAANDASIHRDILMRHEGYRSMLSEGGTNLSGGQRQRLEIARVLAQDPTVIILDEATSALDAKTEYDITQAIRERGITCIIVAHRLSTIRDCDEIIVLDKGKVVERGTHDELHAAGGLYTRLVTSA